MAVKDPEDEPETESGLPASIEAAWGLRERPARGPKPGLSLERIVAAAVELAAAEGLAAVSMSRVARALGSSPMSLYRYVTAKDELLALMVDAALADTPAPPASGGGLARRPLTLGVDLPRRAAPPPVGPADPDQRAARHARTRSPGSRRASPRCATAG